MNKTSPSLCINHTNEHFSQEAIETEHKSLHSISAKMLFKQINTLCNEFGPEKVSVRLGELRGNVSVENLARKDEKLTLEQFDFLKSLLSKEKDKEFRWKDPALKKTCNAWYEQIKSEKIPKKQSMLSYFEREAYRDFTGSRYNLKLFIEDIENKYGGDTARIAGCVIKPDAMSRLCMGYEITIPEMEKIIKIADLTIPCKKIKHLTPKQISDLTWKAFDRDRSKKSPHDNSPDQTPFYFNGMTEEKWEIEKNRRESRAESYNESQWDNESSRCILS